MMRVLVTGATGFIGFHTAARVLREGHAVRALVRDVEKARLLLEPLDVGNADLVVGDMTDEAAVRRALEGCDAVVHAAASVSVTQPKTGDDLFDANVTGTRLVLEAAHAQGASPIVFVSSLLAIFDPRCETTIDSPVVRSSTRYGRSKAASDDVARSLQAAGAPVAIVYPPGVVGPDDPGLSESVRAYGGFLRGTLGTSAGGTQLLDVRDLAELHLRLLERRAGGRTIPAGHFFRWPALAALIEDVTGAHIRRIPAPPSLLRGAGRVGDVLSRLTGRSFPLGGEAMAIATRWRPIPDSPDRAALGLHWRDPRETIEDLFRWLVAAGRLPARAVPRLG